AMVASSRWKRCSASAAKAGCWATTAMPSRKTIRCTIRERMVPLPQRALFLMVSRKAPESIRILRFRPRHAGQIGVSELLEDMGGCCENVQPSTEGRDDNG